MPFAVRVLRANIWLAFVVVAPAFAQSSHAPNAEISAVAERPLFAPSLASPDPRMWLAASEADSRESLFGDDKPANAEPSSPSRSALFADDANVSRLRIAGFVDTLAAYTYHQPAHWSRAVARLQVAAQGEFGNGIKWKASGRVDADPVYFVSDFYPDAVQHDQRFDAFWRENYVDLSAGDWDFRLGAQDIIWGEVIGLFFADVVSARDMREFLLPEFDIIRIPQWAVRAEYTVKDSHLELIWIPAPSFDIIGKPGSEFYPVPLTSPLPEGVADLFRDPERPRRTIGNSNVGVRFNSLVSGWDLSAFYYRSFSTSPTFYRVPGDGPFEPFVFQPRYDRIWQVGGTVGKDLGPAVLKGEAVYTHGQNFSLANLDASPSEVGRQTLDWIASLEWAFARDTRLNLQLFERHYFGGSAEELALPNDGLGGSVYVSTRLTPTLEPQLLWVVNFRDGGGLARPRLDWHAARNLTMTFGVDVFTGPINSYFGRYNNRDRVYAEARFAF